MPYYLRMEDVNIANFVDDTQELSTIRGGSLLLLGAVEEVKQGIASTQLDPITTGASGGMWTFNAPHNEAAEEVRQAVEMFLRRHERLRHATFVVDVQPAGDDFVRDRESLLARNRWRQMRQPTVAIPACGTPSLRY